MLLVTNEVGEKVEIQTPASVILAGPAALSQKIILWGPGQGPEPEMEICFRIVDADALGVLRLRSKSWGFAADLAAGEVANELARINGPTIATF